jgi:hypothetical protein
MSKILPGLCLLLALLAAPKAHAKLPAIIGYGERVAEVADPPTPTAATPPEAAGFSAVKVGYRYNSLRVFWIPVFTWSADYVIFAKKGETYYCDPLDAQTRTEIEKSTGSLASKGGLEAWWARWVNWLWVVVIGLVIARKLIGPRRSGPLRE